MVVLEKIVQIPAETEKDVCNIIWPSTAVFNPLNLISYTYMILNRLVDGKN